jgi:hypothetical protein
MVPIPWALGPQRENSLALAIAFAAPITDGSSLANFARAIRFWLVAILCRNLEHMAQMHLFFVDDGQSLADPK